MTSSALPPFDPCAIRAVAFDGYGTLFDFSIDDFRREVAVILAEQHIETEFDEFFQTWVRSYAAGGVWGDEGPSMERPDSDVVMNGPLPEWHSQWEIWRRQFRAALEAHDLRGDPDAAADQLRAALKHVAPYPDAHDTIEELARRGYLLGLLSNADEDFLQSALSRGRLRFSVIQSSESLRAYKPHRAIFSALCMRLGCAPQEVLYVGDSPVADVAGARNAGLRTGWIRRPAQYPGAQYPGDQYPGAQYPGGQYSGEKTEKHAYPERLPPPDLTIDSLTALTEVLPGAPDTPEGPDDHEGSAR